MIHIYLVLIPFLLLAAALFAATEASLFSLTRPQLESLRESRPWLHRQIRKLVQEPEELLSTVVIGNEFLNISISTFVVTLFNIYFHHLTKEAIAICSVLASSIILLVFSEVLPKVLAFRLPLLVASVLAKPAGGIHWLLTPFRRVFLFVSKKILLLFRIRLAGPAVINEQELRTLVEAGEQTGSLDTDEKQLIYNVFDFSDRPVSSVMTPWKDVVTLQQNLSISEILQRIRERTFSRVPVLSAKDGSVAGILYTKELLKFLLQPPTLPENPLLDHAIFPPYIISGHKKISALFREFKLKKVHIALVVDEWGRNLGVVTLEDLLNALFQTQKRAVNAAILGETEKG